MDETWTTLKALDWTAGRFERAGIESARLEAQVLLAHVLGCDRVGLYTSFDKPLKVEERAEFRELIVRRLGGEPLAYLVGEQEFWSLPFRVDRRVLIPRHDSETMIEVVLDEYADRNAELRIADIATGSGVLGITLAHELKRSRVVATDASADAIELATANAERNGVADRVELREGDLLAPLGEARFDIIVANLPYVASGDIDSLSAEVRSEPRSALDGGVDGLELVRRLIDGLARHLERGGLVALEHGCDQGEAVQALLEHWGELESCETRNDLAGQPRITYGRRKIETDRADTA